MAKKLSTKEILAAARAEAAKQAGGETADAPVSPESDSASDAESVPETESVPEAPASEAAETTEEAPVAKPPAKSGGGGPKSTKDILAAARAQATAKQAGAAAPDSKPATPAKASGGGKPSSTKDILAAARAQSAGGAMKPASENAASTKASPAKPAKAGAVGKAVAKGGASGESPSVAEMLKAVREGRTPQKEEPAAPKMRKPRRPVPVAKPAAKKTSERRFFLWALVATPFAFAWTMFSLASAAATLGMVRYMMPNIVNEPPSRFKVGSPGDYPPNSVATKWKAQYGIWLVNSEYQGENIIYALISICTHLGCTPNWLEGEQKFKCPCHGSGYYITGINFEGPAPRPLERAGIRLAPDGMIEVDKSVKFQQELGQWDEPSSKLPVV